jgi:hypothetical protein
MSRVEPNAVLASAAALVVVVESFTRSQARYGPECVIVAIALIVAWRRRDELRPAVILALAACLPSAIAIVHLLQHVGGDIDAQQVYPTQGQSLLDGVYPRSEYPPGAVLLFAGEQLIRSPRAINPFAMAACQAGIAWCVLRVDGGRWFAAAVALWPASAFFWEFKYDSLPTALLLVGLVLAADERWVPAGLALGAGTAVKWAPGIACALLVVWLLSRSRYKDAAAHAVSALVGFGALVVPFLAWSPSAVWASVSRQAPRGLTAESIWFLPLHVVGKARQVGAVYDAAAVPHWANSFAVVAQIIVLGVLAALLARRATSVGAAVAIAGLGPSAFLLLNRVFSAQYIVTILATICLGAALTRRPGAVALALVGAAANVLVYPVGRYVEAASAVLFLMLLAAAALLLRAALTMSRYPRES